MVFSSQLFLFFFLPLCLSCYYLVSKAYRNIVLLIFSVIFYAWGETQYLWLMGLSVVFNYLWGIFLHKTKYKKVILNTQITNVKNNDKPEKIENGDINIKDYLDHINNFEDIRYEKEKDIRNSHENFFNINEISK